MVPSGYGNIVATEDGDGIGLAAFVLGHDAPRNASHCDTDKFVTVRKVELRSGLDFFHALSAADQQRLETGAGSLYDALGCAGAGVD